MPRLSTNYERVLHLDSEATFFFTTRCLMISTMISRHVITTNKLQASTHSVFGLLLSLYSSLFADCAVLTAEG